MTPMATRRAGRLAGRFGWVLAGALALAAIAPIPAAAEEVALDHWPSARANDRVALQHGAKLFVNYCLNCHSASLMRWNRLTEIGIDEEQIKSQLIFGNQKVGDTMTVALNPRDAKVWFGKAPPDLSVIIRARNTEEHRGTDYVFTLLRGFYRDQSTLTGWNNIVYPKIAMPNILWERMGRRTATITRDEIEETPGSASVTSRLVRVLSVFDVDGNVQVTKTELDHGSPGMEVVFAPGDPKAAASTDEDVADLVAYLNWMSEPTAAARYKIGVWVMGFLAVFLLVGRWLNAVFWRDIR
jgi:ubiquinol-cytochrome c reductase cytochrome c1 subunit